MAKHYSATRTINPSEATTRRRRPGYGKVVGGASIATAAAIVAGIALTAPLVPASAATDSPATADAYTVSTVPTKNYGTADKIAVGLDHKDFKKGYLSFRNLGSVKSSDVIKVKLSVSGDAGTLQAAQTSSSWSEYGINYNNAPAAGRTLATTAVARGSHPVTLALTGITAPDGVVSITLSRPGSGVSRVVSREGAASLRPMATVAAATTAPTSTATTRPTTTSSPSPSTAPKPTTGPVPTAQPSQPAPDPTTPVTRPTTAPIAPTGGPCAVSAKLTPSCGAWFGVAANPLAGESWDTALTNFEKTAGRTMDIAHFYARGQSAMFPGAAELKRQDEPGKNRILFYNWKPSGLSWRQVADGAADGYLKQLAGYMKTNEKKSFFLSLNAEMEDEVNPTAGSGQTAQDFHDFFRHTVSVLRSNGVTNMVTVMNYTGLQKWGQMSWFKDLYPGNDVVDWIAQDPYAFGKGSVWLSDFEGMVNRTADAKAWPGFYNWAAANYPDKPQMLSEWGVDQPAGADPSYKTNFFTTATAELGKLPKLKALVYWDSNGIDTAGKPLSVGTTQISTNTATENAFRQFVGSSTLTLPRASYLK